MVKGELKGTSKTPAHASKLGTVGTKNMEMYLSSA